jgi:hypothetical protein
MMEMTSESRQGVRKLLLGPRALAVISCALALLAAQPAFGAVENLGEQVSSVSAAGPLNAIPTAEPMTVAVNKRTRQATLQQQSRNSTIRRLHVLATVEILQRLLTVELQPMQHHTMSVLILEPVCVLTLDTPTSPPHRTWSAEHAGHSAEGDFAKARLGLAPPLA